MQRIISVIVRSATGGLAVKSSLETINCDDDHTGLDKVVAVQKKSGAKMVMILAEDDSVLRHWTAPVEAEVDAPAPAAPAVKAPAKRK